MKSTLGVILLGVLLQSPARAGESALCDEAATQLATFAGAATAYQLVHIYGGPTGWVAAGLYAAGVGLATAGVKAGSQALCEDMGDLVEVLGEQYLNYACGSQGVCFDPDYFALSLAHDYLVCPSCSPSQIFGAAFMADLEREAYLRQLQGMSNPAVTGFNALPRDHLGVVDPSVAVSYQLGLLAGSQQRFFTEFVQPAF